MVHSAPSGSSLSSASSSLHTSRAVRCRPRRLSDCMYLQRGGRGGMRKVAWRAGTQSAAEHGAPARRLWLPAVQATMRFT